MPRRGTRRVRGPGDMCAWCKHMGAGPNVCTWKSFGKQNKFVSGADVAAACFGHMVASVWDGSNVRRQNKDRLKQCLALSASEVGNAADAPPQHAWAASLLDACKYQELRARCSRAPTGSSSCSGSSEDDENLGSGVESGEGGSCAGAESDSEFFLDWGTPYSNVDRLLGAPRRGVMPGVLKGDGRRCRWCSHQLSIGDNVYVSYRGLRQHGSANVRCFPTCIHCATRC